MKVPSVRTWRAVGLPLLALIVAFDFMPVLTPALRFWISFGLVLALLAVTRLLWPGVFQNEQLVRITEAGVDREGAGISESIRWAELTAVHIATTGDGPGAEDVFFLLQGTGHHGCCIGHELAVKHQLLARLQRLPRFDNLAVIRAMGSADDALFECWRGEPGEGLVCALAAS